MDQTSDSRLDEQHLRETLQILRSFPDEPLAVDTETTGLSVADSTNHVIGISFACVIDGAPLIGYVPIAHETGTNVHQSTQEMLQLVLKDRPLIFANVQFDMIGLGMAGYNVFENEFYDILTMANLVNENKPITKSLEMLSRTYLGPDEGKVKDKFVEAEKKSGNHNITPEQMYEYAVSDAELTYRVWIELINHKEWIELSEKTTIWPDKQELIRVLVHMKMRGVLLDPSVARQQIEVGEKAMADLEEAMGFQPTKRKELAEALLDTLQLPVLKSGKTGPSFDKEVMSEYEHLLAESANPLARQILDWRGWQKALTASYVPYLRLVGADGRIRTTFNTHRVATGRLSSSEPNLQQVPKVTDKPWNGRVKECFVAREGFILLSADYSQLELRLLTAYAGESSLKQVFEEGRDLFTEMSEALGMSRQQTKGFVYANNYGAGDKKIASQFHIDLAKAKRIRSNYIATYPRFANFNAACTMKAETEKRVKLWSGRYRHFQYPNEGYKAMNSVIQGGAADIVEAVMRKVYRELDTDGECELLLQVHDALVFEVRADLEDEYRERIKDMMEDVNGAVGAPLFDVKFNVEVTGWSE